MQANKHSKTEGTKRVDSLLNNIITDMHALTKILKPISKAASDANASLTNKMALRGAKEWIQIVNELLSYLMNIVEVRHIGSNLIAIITKLISMTKIMLEVNENSSKFQRPIKENKQIEQFLHQIIDLIFVLNNKTQQPDIVLRIVQTAYSLVQPHLILFADYNMLTRLYAIIFKCCLSSANILSIGISVLFSLSQIAFAHSHQKYLTIILVEMLEMLLHGKKCSWLKDLKFNSMVWDISLIGIKNFPSNKLQTIKNNNILCNLLNEMYRSAQQFSFVNKENHYHLFFTQSLRLDIQKHTNPLKQPLIDFIKVFKVYIYFSIKLSLSFKDSQEIVPFRKQLDILHNIYDHFHSTKLFIYLEGVSLLLSHASHLIFEQPAGIMLIDLFKKLSQQLYHSKVPLQLVWEDTDLRIQKPFSDYSKITNQDFMRLLKRTLVRLRKDVENFKDLKVPDNVDQSLQTSNISMESQLSKKGSETMMTSNRWKLLIKTISRIMRYITSLNFKQETNDQVIRKFLTQLQFWFTICPNNKTRTIILQQLQNSVVHVQNKNQAIKASQSIQICCNIVYGYYGVLDSGGIAIILRTIAYVKIHVEDGRDFGELQQVCQATDKFYVEQKIIDSEMCFFKTIEGFIQCANILQADMQLPQNKEVPSNDAKKQMTKYLKLIDYVFTKLKFVIEQNSIFLSKKWNYVVCFWVSFCSCKVAALRTKTINHVGFILSMLQKKGMIKQAEIMSAYYEISKLQQPDVSSLIITQIRSLVVNMKEQSAFVSILQITKQIMSIKKGQKIREQAFELQQMLIKELLFKIKFIDNLVKIVQTLSLQNKTKNQEYRTVSLLWSISDHVKSLQSIDKSSQNEKLWTALFQKFLQFSTLSNYAETKNTCMHTFTQILADCNKAMGDELFIKIFFAEYLRLFEILMSYNETGAHFDNTTKVEMEKAGIKSFIKLCKKCMHQNNPKIQTFFSEAISIIVNGLEQKDKVFSVEYFYEFFTLLQFIKETIIQNKEKGGFIIDIQMIKRMLVLIESKHEGFNKQGFFWKKKYEPQFKELKTFFDQL